MLKTFTGQFSFLLALLLATFTQRTFAQAGTPDSTFSSDGIVLASFSATYLITNSVAIQPDGKIVTAGGRHWDPPYPFALARFNSDGVIDSSFGTNGIVFTSIALQDEANAVAIQTDGKILAAGVDVDTSSGKIALVRYNSNGTPDSGFNGDGIVTTDINAYQAEAFSMAIQVDGKIVVAGTANVPYSGRSFALVRYNTDGSPDSSFGNNGIVTTHVSIGYYYPGDYSSVRSVAIQPDGKIVAAGSFGYPTYNYYYSYREYFALARYNADGAIDSSFGTDGVVLTDFGDYTTATAEAVAIQPDGKIVTAGHASIPMEHVALVRYNADGSADSSFGSNGIVTTTFDSTWCEASAVGIQPDGKIVTAGAISIYGLWRWMFVRFNANGAIDSSFNGDGKAIPVLGDGGEAICNSMVIQPDGKIVGAGYAEDSMANHTITVLRYNSGSCNASFTLVPDTLLLHHYWALNQATGIPPLSYVWNWSDGTYDSIAYPSHIYSSAGFYTICLTIQDSTGCISNHCFTYDILKLSAAEADNTIIKVDVVDSIPSIPTPVENTSILQSCSVFPNPVSGHSFINYSLSTPAHVSIEMDDVLGNTLQLIRCDDEEKGEHADVIDAGKLPDGIYVLQITAGNEVSSLKMIVIK